MTVQLKRNDTKDTISYSITNPDGSIVTLTGASVKFVMGKNKTLITNAAATIVNAAAGTVSYTLTESDTLAAGTFNAEFEVTFSNGKVKTYPTNGYIQVKIEANIDKDQSTYIEDQIAYRVSDIQVLKNSIQAQLDQFAAGATNAETSQARVEADGTTNATLKARLDKKEAEFKAFKETTTTNLAQNMTKIDKKANKINMEYFGPQLFCNNIFTKTGVFDWNSQIVKDKMVYYKNLNMNTFTLLPYFFIDANQALVKCYSNVAQAIQYAHSLGLKVVIRPHASNLNNDANGNQIINETILLAWENAVLDLATISQQNNAEGFVFGVECAPNFGLYNEARARQSIQRFKDAYDVGFFSYGGTMAEADKIMWWDMCDYIGVDFYNFVTKNIYATPAEIYQGFYSTKNVIYGSTNYASTATAVSGYDFLKNLNVKWEKPIFLTEWYVTYGYNNAGGTNFKDKLATYPDIDLEQKQADGMDASLSFFNDLDFVVGNSIWCDLADKAISDYSWDDGKFIGRIKSENIVKKWGAYFG